MSEESGNMEIDNQQIDTELPDRFSELGFGEGDWEMFVLKVGMYDPDKLVKLYLKISRKPPYSTGWRTEAAASNSTEYDKKHDIATDTLESYSPEQVVTDSTDSNVMDDDYVDNKGPVPAAGGKRRRKSKRRKSKRITRRITKRRTRRSRKSRR
jgi:hypothetical protein